MATSFAKAQAATFTKAGSTLAEIEYYSDVQIRTATPNVNVIGVTDLTEPYFAPQLPTVAISGKLIHPTHTGLAQTSTWTTFGDNFKPADYSFTKRWPLVDITGVADSEKEFGWRLPVITGQVRGWSTGDTDHLQTGGAMTIQLNSVLSTIIVADASTTFTKILITDFTIGIPKRTGGPIPVSVQFIQSGKGTGGNADMDRTKTNPDSGNITWSTTSGPTQSAVNVINNVTTIEVPVQTGGPCTVTRQWTRSKA